jgi:hypothetical protein
MTYKRHIEKSGKNYTIHTVKVKEKKMQEIDYKSNFNKIAKALDKVYMSNTMTDEQKLFAFNNIAESANGRPHACGIVDDKKQLKLEF